MEKEFKFTFVVEGTYTMTLHTDTLENARTAARDYIKGVNFGCLENVKTTLKGDTELRLTDCGKKTVSDYIRELAAKRKEILDAGKDTADNTTIPTEEDILSDVNWIGFDDNGEYYNGWAVTDNYDADYPILLKLGRDLQEVKV